MVYRANFPNLKGPRAPSQNCKKNPWLLLLILTLIHRKVVCRLSGGIYIRKKRKVNNNIKLAEDTLFCFQSVKFSKKLAYGQRRLSNDCHYFRGRFTLERIHNTIWNTRGLCLSVCECVRLRAGVTACLPFCHRWGGGGGTLFLFINLSESPIPWGRSVFLSVYLFGNKTSLLFA